MIGKFTSAILAVALIAALTPPGVSAPIKSSTKIVNIRSDRGGEIYRYAQRANLYVRSGSILRLRHSAFIFPMAQVNQPMLRQRATSTKNIHTGCDHGYAPKVD